MSLFSFVYSLSEHNTLPHEISDSLWCTSFPQFPPPIDNFHCTFTMFESRYLDIIQSQQLSTFFFHFFPSTQSVKLMNGTKKTLTSLFPICFTLFVSLYKISASMFCYYKLDLRRNRLCTTSVDFLDSNEIFWKLA